MRLDVCSSWIDFIDPTSEELESICAQYSLPAHLVKHCLDPEHLPKFEVFSGGYFILLRAFDELAVKDADSVQELTRKVAVFVLEKNVVTVHRKDQAYLKTLGLRWSHNTDFDPQKFLVELLQAVFFTYERPIDAAYTELEQLEMGAFGAHGARPFELENAYYLRRRIFVFKHMLRLSLELLSKMEREVSIAGSKLLHEECASRHYFAEELSENIHGLLNLHLSLSAQRANIASQRTNEIIRFLTILSVCLLPLNVITGVYGMNFEHMPELKSTWGYPAALSAMAFVFVGSVFWIRRQGWFK